jgi:SAM-dependent methyltransferase
MILRKLSTAVRDPRKLACYVVWRMNRLQVRRIETPDGVVHEYRGERYPDYLNHGNACSFISERALAACQGAGIDVGASSWPLPGATPVRDEPHQNAYKLDAFPDGSLDYVFSSHCVEHLRRWRDALGLWARKLKPGGTLFLYLPHESMKLWRRCGPWVGLGHEWIPTHEVLVPFLTGLGLDVVEFNPGRDSYWSFHVVARRPLEP